MIISQVPAYSPGRMQKKKAMQIVLVITLLSYVGKVTRANISADMTTVAGSGFTQDTGVSFFEYDQYLQDSRKSILPKLLNFWSEVTTLVNL